MKTLIRITVVVLTLIIAFAGTVCAKDKNNGKEFDFAKTGAFMREMETRPDFPVSIVLANDYVYSLLAMGDDIDPVRKSATISYIKNSQQKNGGFAAAKADKEPALLFTDLALETLGCLKSTEVIDAGRVKSFVVSLKNPDGGFGFSPESRGSSLATTFYAVRILKAVGGLDLIDKEKTAHYIKGFERRDGGFGYVPGMGVADAKNTYMSAFVLKSLGKLDASTMGKAIKFLATTPYLDNNCRERRDIDGQLYAILALKELRAGAKINRKIAMAFLKKIYIPLNGGFGPLEGYGSTPDSTTTAIRILAETGKLKTSGISNTYSFSSGRTQRA
jgi:prenyltransferase beta subunit